MRRTKTTKTTISSIVSISIAFPSIHLSSVLHRFSLNIHRFRTYPWEKGPQFRLFQSRNPCRVLPRNHVPRVWPTRIYCIINEFAWSYRSSFSCWWRGDDLGNAQLPFSFPFDSSGINYYVPFFGFPRFLSGAWSGCVYSRALGWVCLYWSCCPVVIGAVYS